MRLKLHKLFQQYHHNFQTFSRINTQSIRQNKLKELESNYRKFQLQCINIQSASIWPSQYTSFQTLFNQSDKQQTLSTTLVNTLVNGLINHALNESINLSKKVQQTQGITFAEQNLKKKHNPYKLREQTFFINKKIKQKIDMKPFIQ